MGYWLANKQQTTNNEQQISMLEIKDLHTYYGNIHALKGITLHVEQGEVVTLIGSNGAGKTTTLRTIQGLLRPREGKILFEGGS
jgi:branched-chain amino acid transport system ATP-binding protein